MVKGIGTMLTEFGSETPERVFKSHLYKRNNQVLRIRGGNDFVVKRTGTAQRQKMRELATAAKSDGDVFNAALGW